MQRQAQAAVPSLPEVRIFVETKKKVDTSEGQEKKNAS